MDRQKYEAEIKEFFEDYESKRKESAKEILECLAIAVTGLAVGILLKVLIPNTITKIILAFGIILAITEIGDAFREMLYYRYIRKSAEKSLSDDMVNRMIADAAGCKCEVTEGKGEPLPAPLSGYTAKSRKKVFTGTRNGREFTLQQEYTHKITPAVKSGNAENDNAKDEKIKAKGFTVTGFRFEMSNPVNSEVFLESKGYGHSQYFDTGSLAAVRMDNNKFPYRVQAADTVTAYKLLTPEMMERITGFSKKYKNEQILYSGNAASFLLNSTVVDMKVRVAPLAKARRLSSYEAMRYANSKAIFQD